MFDNAGKFNEWKSEIAVLMANLALDKASQARTKLASPLVVGALGLLVGAPSFDEAIIALEAIVPLDRWLKYRVERLRCVNRLRRFVGTGSACQTYLMDAYAACVESANLTKEVAAKVDEVSKAVLIKTHENKECIERLDRWQQHLYRLAVLSPTA
ncbi:MAG: hypothetical protein K2W95_24865 [Candidatus Obscuribacterales bacterium]|nr:hypothetical protein [Candidatus Obscuribacterales bacterium]